MKTLILAVSGAIIWFVMISVLILGSIGKEVPKMANTVVTVTPSSTILAAGAPFSVTVAIAPGVAIAGAQFDLSFNPQALKVNSVTEGNLFKQGGAGTYFMPGTIDNVNGSVKAVVDVITGAGQNVSTSGIVAVFSCTALIAGQASAFNLQNVIVGNPAGQPVPLASFSIIQMAVASPLDLNSDGKIDVNDMKIVAGAFGQTGTGIPSDVNKDSIVNVLDMIIVGQNYT